ncbi:hypothetical protein JHN48_34425, partial [Streptomyces sp. MBT72]|uniref:hypothetical protein n=1 Tax=Streptomyces sp. MBT72 TaxID=1488402 RepID=UPI001916BFE6
MFANGERRAIVDYGADPRERFAGTLFATLWSTVQGKLTAPYRPADDNPNGGTFNGLHAPVQAFMGADFLAANPVQY